MLECCGRVAYKFFVSTDQRHRNTWREKYRRKDPIVYFMVVWFVIGSMWVYQVNSSCFDCPDAAAHEKTFALEHAIFSNQTSSFSSTIGSLGTDASENAVVVKKNRYCDKEMYRFAFWLSTSYYMAIAVFCFLVLVDVFVRIISRCFRHRTG